MAIPIPPEDINEEMCICGHILDNHDETGDYEPGKPSEGACLDPDCACTSFVLAGT